MQFKIRHLLVGFCSCLVIGCSEAEPECESLWQMDRDQLTATALIKDGALRIEVLSAEPGIGIDVYQEGLSGDFDIYVEFDAFSQGSGSGGFAQMVVYDPNAEFHEVSGVSMGAGMIDAFVNFPTNGVDSRITGGTTGSIQFVRVDSLLTTMISVEDKTASISDQVSTSDLTIAFQLGSNQDELIGTTGITISKFEINEGEGIESDNFHCATML